MAPPSASSFVRSDSPARAGLEGRPGTGAPVVKAGTAHLGQLIDGRVDAAPEAVTVIHTNPGPSFASVFSTARLQVFPHVLYPLLRQPSVKGSRVAPLSSTQTLLFSV